MSAKHLFYANRNRDLFSIMYLLRANKRLGEVWMLLQNYFICTCALFSTVHHMNRRRLVCNVITISFPYDVGDGNAILVMRNSPVECVILNVGFVRRKAQAVCPANSVVQLKASFLYNCFMSDTKSSSLISM